MMDPTVNRLIEMLAQLTQLRIEFYKADMVFTWRWWLLLVMTIIPWIIWWLLVDKRRLNQILLFGAIGVILNVIADEHLVNLTRYAYPYRLDPLWGSAITGNISYPPVLGMLIYQYFPRWRNYLIALLIGSAFIAFVGLPLLKIMGSLILLRWNYFYSFLLLVLYGCLIKWIVDKVKRTELAQG